MNKWMNFKTKYLGKISKMFSWLFNIVSLILAIISFMYPDYNLNWAVILFVIIFNSLFLIIVSIYETLLYKRGAKLEEETLQEKSDEIEKLKNSLFCNEDLFGKSIYYYKYIVKKLNKFNTQLYAINSDLAKFRKNMDDYVKKCDSDFGKNGEATDDYFYQLIKDEEIKYRKCMLKEFNDFLSKITNKLKYILDIYLKKKGCSLETSISVKQFSRIVTDIQDINDVTVITTYRDNQTYTQDKREVGKVQYTILNNTDFLHCLKKPYFLKNNISSKDKTYNNEHEGFLEYYNCTIVVPIKYDYPDCSHFYGYLTCDIHNDDFSKNNLLDDKMAEIMEVTANVISAYFDNMDFQWDYVLEDDFLDIVYNMKKTF